MNKSELKQLIRETIEEATMDRIALSKQGLEVIKFLRDNESEFTTDGMEEQDVRRVRGYIESILTDEDYKRLHPRAGKLGGGDREDFARGT